MLAILIQYFLCHMRKKLFVFSLILAGFSVFFVDSAYAASGSSNTNVTSCEQVSNGIKISRNKSAKYVLTNGCRDAGYGFRNYTMTCNSATQYKTSWTTNCPQNQDKTAPLVSIYSEAAVDATGTGAKIFVVATDNIKVAKIDIYSGTKIIKTCLKSNTCDVFVKSTDSKIGYRARAFDSAGNNRYSNYIYLFTADKSAPMVSANYTRLDDGRVRISTRAYDNGGSGVAKTEIYQDNVLSMACNGESDCTIMLFPGTKTISYSFIAKAYDRAGNVGQSSPLIVTVYPKNDLVAPVINLSGVVKGDDYILTITATDQKTRIASLDILMNDGSKAIYSWSDAANNSLSVTKVVTGTLPLGTTKFIARASDSNGNSGVSAPLYLTSIWSTDNAPTIEVEARLESQFGVDNISLSGRATDDHGLSKVELFWGSTVGNITMIKRCTYQGLTKSETCSVVFPSLLSRSGFYYATAYDGKNQAVTSAAKSYSF